MDSQLQQLRGNALRATKDAIKKSVQADTLAIQAINSLETTQKTTNSLVEKFRDWCALYNPEFSHTTETDCEFVDAIATKNNAELFKQIGKNEDESMAGVLNKKDTEAVTSFARGISTLFKQERELENYLHLSLKEICPNTLTIAGILITARLLSFAGGLKNLAEMPSSRIQLLGAEKAVFRHVKKGTKTPKFGILHNHPLLQQTGKQKQGKIARILADKIAIASKVDYFKGKFIGDELKKQVEQKIK